MNYQVICADAIEGLRQLPHQSVQTCVTSPPYFGLRDYGVSGQIGLEPTPAEYVARLVDVFREVRRVMADDGTVWLNLGDSYATGGGRVGAAPCGGKQGENWRLRGLMTPPNRLPLPGLKPKDLIGIPWRVAFALQADGWYLRSDIVWAKLNPMPESVTDRPTKAHEYLFLLAKRERYCYDSDAIREPFVTNERENYPARAEITGRGEQGFAEARGNDRDKSGRFPPKSHKGSSFTVGKTGVNGLGRVSEEQREDNWLGRNKRSVWSIATKPFAEAHFAVMPEALVEPCILAGCPEGGTVLDPFTGSGTTGVVALKNGRNFVGTELNPEYVTMARRRLASVMPMFAEEIAV